MQIGMNAWMTAAATLCAASVTATLYSQPAALSPGQSPAGLPGAPAATTHGTYVGSTACRRCHAATYDRWAKTRMANVVRDPRQHPEQARAFVIVWAVIVGLLAIVVALAVVDAIGTAGWGYVRHRALRKEFRIAQASELAARSTSAQNPQSPGDAPRG